MIRKCLVANIPIIPSGGATSFLAVYVAKQAQLTIVSFVQNQKLKMNIYTNAERVKTQEFTE
jgi:FdhD protein